MPRTIRVLSIDGGGIRGIIPAVVLSELESRTGRPIHELFDLIGGTSTGGILALGLTAPGPKGTARHSARALLELYESEGNRIFRRSPLHTLAGLGGLLEERYPDGGLERVLTEQLGDARLSEALTEILVACYDIERRRPFFFKSHKARSQPARDFLMRDAARATAAAPTYFEPARVPLPEGPGHRTLIDGGVFVNNPAMAVYVEARMLFGGDSQSLIVSLGTGEQTRRISYEQARKWGIVNWAQPLIGIVFDGVSDAIDYQLQQLHAGDTEVRRYYRLQTKLVDANDDLDDASDANIAALKRLGEKMVADNEEVISELARLLPQ
jgi:uncharacterized protein